MHTEQLSHELSSQHPDSAQSPVEGCPAEHAFTSQQTDVCFASLQATAHILLHASLNYALTVIHQLIHATCFLMGM